MLGLLRDVLLASVLGASAQSDGFLVAFKVPNLLRRLFTEGAFAAALVPHFIARRAVGSSAVAASVAELTGAVIWIAGALTVVLLVAAPGLVWLLAPGYIDDPIRTAATTTALRWMAGFVPCICLVGVLVATLHAHGRFVAGAVVPLVLNLVLIAAATVLLVTRTSSAAFVAAAVSVGGAAQLLVVWIAVRRLGVMRWPRPAPFGAGVGRQFRALVPVMLAASVLQLHLLVDTWVASFLAPGPVSWLYYAERVLELPAGLLAVGLVTVLLPALSRSSQQQTHFAAQLDWALGRGLVTAVPAAAALWLLAEPIVYTLFARGAFSAADARQSAAALAAYAPGLVGLVAAKLLLPGYYARQDAVRPLRLGMLSLGLNVLLSALAMPWFGHVGLAAATSMAALFNAAMLWWGLGSRRPGRGLVDWSLPPLLWRVVLATTVLALGLGAVRDLVDWQGATELRRFLSLAGIVTAGLATYAGAALCLGVRRVLRPAPVDL